MQVAEVPCMVTAIRNYRINTNKRREQRGAN